MIPFLSSSDCPERCPGCRHRDLSPLESQQQKFNWVSSQLSSWGNEVESVRSVSEAFQTHYRNKVCLHAEWSEGFWKIGLRVRRRDSENTFDTEVIPIPRCPIQSLKIRKALQWVSHRFPSTLPLVYVAISGDLLTLVLKVQTLTQEAHQELFNVFSSQIAQELELGIQGVWLNLNPSAGHRVFSSRGWKKLWGKERALEDGFYYGPESFQQLIPELHLDSLREAKEFLTSDIPIAMLDLYSGVGRSLSLWQSMGIPAIGVELSGDAFECMKINLKQEHHLRGKVSHRIPQLQSWISQYSGFELTAYVNPPRLGLEPEVSRWLSEVARPRRLAYLSCSVGTLKRDLQVFLQAGYQIRRIIPYDFFPKTDHVETLVLLD